MDIEEKSAEDVNMAYYSDATSFEEVERLVNVRESKEEVEYATEAFTILTKRIIDGPTDERESKMTNLIREYMDRIRKFLTPENKDISEGDEIPAKSTAFDKYNIPTKQTQNLVSGDGIAVWKDNTGNYRWFTAYSNNFLDDDNPQEIISEGSHKTFVKMVDEGIVPYPELWLWHVPGSRCGVADMVDYSDNFAVASGTFDPGRENVAKSLSEMVDLRVSHGMLGYPLHRDPIDKNVITFHITKEISPLPAQAAANKRTMFTIVQKEGNSGMDEAKKQFLADANLDPDEIESIEQGLAKASQEAIEEGIPSKEKDGDTDEEIAEVVYVTRDEVASVFAEVLEPITTTLGSLTARLDEISSEVKELKQSDAEKIVALKEETPAPSLSSIIFDQISKSKISPDSELANSKPTETENVISQTGIAFLDKMIGGE